MQRSFYAIKKEATILDRPDFTVSRHSTGGRRTPARSCAHSPAAVSYTHLDVYKRQLYARALDFAVRNPADPADDPRPRRAPHYITRSFDARQNRWVDEVDPDAPAMTLARALGLSPETFGWLEGAGDRLLQGERTLLDLSLIHI